MFFTSKSSKHCPLVKPKIGYEKVLDWSKICMCQPPTMLLCLWFFKDISRSWNKDASRCWKIEHYFLYVGQLCKKLSCACLAWTYPSTWSLWTFSLIQVMLKMTKVKVGAIRGKRNTFFLEKAIYWFKPVLQTEELIDQQQKT